jgi:tetratricopeptide (TPR) repeat protein
MEQNTSPFGDNISLVRGFETMADEDLALEPQQSATVLSEKARRHLLRGELVLAEKLYRLMIEKNLASETEYTNLAVVLRRSGRKDEAVQCLWQALAINPDKAEIWFNLGNIQVEKRLWEQAVESFTYAIGIRPDFPEALLNLGTCYYRLGVIESAIASFNKALCIRPDYEEARYHLGCALQEQGLFQASVYAFEKLIEACGDQPDILLRLGIGHEEVGAYDQALGLYNRYLRRRGDDVTGLYRLGNLQWIMGDTEGSKQTYRRAVEGNVESAKSAKTVGVYCLEMGDIALGLEFLERSTHLNRDYIDGQLSYALALLLSGRLREGWERYDWRLAKTDHSKFIRPNAHWIAGTEVKSLFVSGEQGIGDQIMFASMLQELKHYANEVTVQVDRRLVTLFQRSMPEIRFVDPTERLSAESHQAAIPMGSLGRFFRSHMDMFPKQPRQYLKVDEQRSREIGRDLGQRKRITIGISWYSARKYTDLEKSVPLALLAKALSKDGVELVSLQYGDARKPLLELARESGITVQRVASVDNYFDLDGLASVIDQCDLVVSAANATVHLSGALAKPTWALLKHIPDWRWGLEKDYSYWYPSVRLYRQQARGDWGSVLDRVSADLDQWALRQTEVDV